MHHIVFIVLPRVLVVLGFASLIFFFILPGVRKDGWRAFLASTWQRRKGSLPRKASPFQEEEIIDGEWVELP
jgi:hypothetical protein